MTTTRLILLSLLLTGCITHTYSKPGAGQAELDRDTYACAAGARVASPVSPIAYPPTIGYASLANQTDALSASLFDLAASSIRTRACLRSLGWKEE